MATEGKHRLAAVLFADIVGYTDLSSRDEKAALRVVDELQRLAREEVESRGGRIVKFVGDAVLTVFDSRGQFGVSNDVCEPNSGETSVAFPCPSRFLH